jgi:hypothetical protein
VLVPYYTPKFERQRVAFISQHKIVSFVIFFLNKRWRAVCHFLFYVLDDKLIANRIFASTGHWQFSWSSLLWKGH